LTLMKKHFWKILVVTAVLVSCHQRKEEMILITGKVTGQGEKLLFLDELKPDGVSPVDSAVPGSGGEFSFRVKPNETTGFYLLGNRSGHQLTLVLQSGETVQVNASLLKDPVEYDVTGSPGSELLRNFILHTGRNLHTADSLTAILRKMEGTPAFYPLSQSYDTIFRNLLADQQAFERSLIRNNSSSLAALIILNHRFGDRVALDPKENADLFLLLDSTLSRAYPGNRHVLFHHQRCSQFRNHLP
jgi:hypothetical protein